VKIEGQTPIEHAEELAPALRERLRGLWIESLEEYVSALAATERALVSQAFDLPPQDLEASLRAAASALGSSKTKTLASPRVGGRLGCRVDPLTMEVFTRERKLPRREHRIPASMSSGLPSSVRLFAKMLPVRNQGERGTCVAFACVALREFLLGDRTELSEQFLYWACKELDGYPGPGTYVHTGAAALSIYGVCRAKTWPYNPHDDDPDQGQGPPPPGAIEEAKRYIMLHSRAVEPGAVDLYRAVLAGDQKTPAMPVVIATFVFNSWYLSPETHRTGKITLPLPNEDPIGGHAWCVVGYQDDPSVPGGGYFILRNSWGEDWAKDSPEAPGHAMMPYEYVARYALEAFSGELASLIAAEDQTTGDFTQYLRHLDRPARDIEGKLLPKGTTVIANPLAPGQFMQDTPTNREAFRKRDFAWSDELRQKLWFKDTQQFSQQTRAKLHVIHQAKERFTSAIDLNISSSVGARFPQPTTPLWLNLVPFDWEPTTKRAEPVADLTDTFLQTLQRGCGPPPDLEWPPQWSELLRDLNHVRVFSLQRGRRRIHVLAAFLTRLTVAQASDPVLLPPDQALVDDLWATYRKWLTAQQLDPSFTFVTIGCAAGPPRAVPVEAHDRIVVLSHLDSAGSWNTILPKRFGDRHAMRDFLDRLKPETHPERVARIKDCVDALILEGGNVTVEKVKNRTGYRRSAIQAAFATLQREAAENYRLYRTSSGQLAIRTSRPGEPITLTTASLRLGFLRRHALRFLGAALGASGWLLREALHLSGVFGFVAFAIILYTTSCMQAAINRRASGDRE